ncbi:MAG: glucosamine-6-phosphate deaminase [Planctomycetota bacterium]|nr:glucosamine-6-phosphate deaminase [Planctomycetota bacterium]
MHHHVHANGDANGSTGLERVPVTVHPSSSTASKAVAKEIAELIRDRASKGQKAVLGLATGSTPQAIYDELVRMHREEGLSFRNVVTFNLDEYYPMHPEALQSYNRFMREYLFDHIDIDMRNVNIPDGTIPRDKVGAFCERYEKKIREAGGIDLQILGIGRTGHIGFNEPGSPRDSRTRLITLDRVTRIDAGSDFFGEWNVPKTAITMGVGTILDAKKVVLLAFGEHKAGIVKRAVEGEVTGSVSGSYLQKHPDARFVLDPAAAAELTRIKTPWLLGPVSQFGLEWDEKLVKRAAIWLATTLGKPILKLTNEDYNEHGLQELLSERGGAYDINIHVFKALQSTITGWPGGKPKDRAGVAPVGGAVASHPADNAAGWAAAGSGEAFPKRVIVFSPHPDDDVISMGGTFIRLCEQGHEVHVAYQTSGNIAVFDENAIRHADFVTEFCREFHLELGASAAEKIETSVVNFVKDKTPGEVDSPELQKIKTLIRRTEARAGAKYSGVHPDRIHFLDLPFYETGRVKKKPLGEEDIRITCELLDRVKPHQVYVAGDLSDPHGTHRTCLAAVTTALARLDDRPWRKNCVVWLYRGAWQEWEPHEVEMAVPLSPEEVLRKRLAIFKHESQKDKALFPGPDQREFWQRAEERNRNTARLYDKLGLAEYEAIEGFVRWQPSAADGTVKGLVRAKAGASKAPAKAVAKPVSKLAPKATPKAPAAKAATKAAAKAASKTGGRR